MHGPLNVKVLPLFCSVQGNFPDPTGRFNPAVQLVHFVLYIFFACVFWKVANGRSLHVAVDVACSADLPVTVA